MINEKKIEGTDMTNIPKRIYIIDYQLEQCEVDGISDARLNARPFHTTNGNLVEYLCLDTLWHDASEEPKETDKSLLCQCSNGEYITHPFKPTLGEWHERCEFVGITRWLYIEDLMKGGE